MAATRDLPIELYASCPPVTTGSAGYGARVDEVARWSERAGCRGILIYTDNRQLDAWLVAQRILAATDALTPLVAVQPAYMHPYAAAKMIASLAVLHGRRVDLNLVSGGFKNDLAQLGDATPHDRRYARLTEYMSVVGRLLAGEAVELDGEFYRVAGLRLTPALPPELRPTLFVSGSSAPGREAARLLDAVAVEYPEPATDAGSGPADGLRHGIRVGIVSRPSEEEAWTEARRRFPQDRRGELTHQLAMKVSDSVWHRQLSATGDASGGTPYWLHPFQTYAATCPYLVGSYETVGAELARYIARGTESLIVDVPPDERDLWHVRSAIEASAPRERAAS